MAMRLMSAGGAFRAIAAASLSLNLSGCAATYTLLSHKDLDVRTRTSTAIFVDPVAREKRTIYLDVKSGVQEFDRRMFKAFVREQFTKSNDNGFQIVDDPGAAQFTMIAYVLNLEKVSATAAEEALHQGYRGSSVLGGAVAGGLMTRSVAGVYGGGLIGGTAEFVAGALVKDVTYMLVCDVQIRERAGGGAIVRKDTSVTAGVSDFGSSQQSVSEVTDQKEYRTRIVTTANKANLDLAEAQETMFKKTAYAMAGFF